VPTKRSGVHESGGIPVFELRCALLVAALALPAAADAHTPLSVPPLIGYRPYSAFALSGGGTALGEADIGKEAQDASYNDTTGDAAGGGADIRSVAVVNDANGNIGISVFYANRTCAVSGDLVPIFLDTDQNLSTGSDNSGFEYVLFVDFFGNRRGILQWNGTSFAIVSLGSLSAACDPGGFDSWIFNRADVGIANGFAFVVASYRDPTGTQILDQAPDRRWWNYPPPPPPPPPPPAVSLGAATSRQSCTRARRSRCRHRSGRTPDR
jgi:hypothetical protein